MTANNIHPMTQDLSELSTPEVEAKVNAEELLNLNKDLDWSSKKIITAQFALISQ